MNKFFLFVFLLLFGTTNSKLCAQAAFKNTAYAYTSHPEDGFSDTLKVGVAIYDKDSVLLFDTTWDYEPYKITVLVKEYNREGKTLKKYSRVNDQEEQIVVFVRDSDGRLVEQIFKGGLDFSFKTQNVLDTKGRVVEAISKPIPMRKDNESFESVHKSYYNERDKVERQETYINKQLLKVEIWKYDENSNIINYSVSDNLQNSSEVSIYEYDRLNRVVRLNSYIDDEFWAAQENEWNGKLLKSSVTRYTDGWNNYVFYQSALVD